MLGATGCRWSRISRIFFPPPHTTFKFKGSPAQFRGPGNELSVSYVLAADAKGEPMRIHCLPAYLSALYLVEYEKRSQLLLLDSGCPQDVSRVKFYVENVMNRERSKGEKLSLGASLKLVVVTHCHIDHSGGSGGYAKLGIPIAAATNMESSYAGFVPRVLQFFEASFTFFIAHRLGRRREDPFDYSKGIFGPYWPCCPDTPYTLGDSQSLPLGFEDWVSVKIPGHTSHMIGLFHPPTGMFYCADFTVKLKRGFFAPWPVNFPWAYQHTWERLRDLQVRYLLLPHGGIVDVEKEYGSWDTILANVKLHYEEELSRFAPTKDHSTPFRVYLGHFLSYFLRYPNFCESRKFGPEDLDCGPVPELWENPHPVRVLS